MIFQIYKNKKRLWCWRVRARNNKIIAHGESYKRKRDVLRVLELLCEMGYCNCRLVELK